MSKKSQTTRVKKKIAPKSETAGTCHTNRSTSEGNNVGVNASKGNKSEVDQSERNISEVNTSKGIMSKGKTSERNASGGGVSRGKQEAKVRKTTTDEVTTSPETKSDVQDSKHNGMHQKTSATPSIRQQVFDLDFDLKAETFVARLMEENVPLDISMADFFKRRFSQDLTLIGDEVDPATGLEVHLSRRSFYNIFPERFFHATYSSTPYVETMVSDYKGRKNEELEARKFFKPLETEFFLHRVAVEKAEDETLQALGSPELADFMTDLWNIDIKIPNNMMAKILKSMPLMYKIAGNLSLVQSILENIIEERVKIEKDFLEIPHQIDDAPWQLGVNMATAGRQLSFLPKYKFTITDVNRPDQIEDYLPEGKIIAVARYFLEHTMPFESDFEIGFTIAEAKTDFVLSDLAYAGRLGVSATI